MLSHKQIWSAIDTLAEHNGMSVSALARRAGLDPTSFNRSKRLSSDGRQRWPSTESISRILEATGCTISDFANLAGTGASPKRQAVPLLGFAQAGDGGYFDDGGFPTGHGWDVVDMPATASRQAYALQVQGESMLPLYRNGDTLIVDPEARVRRGDRVVARTRDGEIMAKILRRNGPELVELASLNPDHADRHFTVSEIDWIARIVWASQ
ncbi:helix-turn-helix transcriptional regulator [Hoeflea prorocentri]|uniref:Helix-turn-helix transcriptional regulator n=1 Tax=Hoeflea prorocentri TaxID=1922333 RepID=A0A9X3UJI4_9HYPH|nr:helix-turn-helix transcriptional regulator [Hoeflea prorocentri]MCY6382518.1 helix-turn-helix transcriptional regulator [Hoeflea prorocentri]MDA5400318.1 helix-turn-helix transcriptional regulator [Hoeflea prorocentri]